MIILLECINPPSLISSIIDSAVKEMEKKFCT